MRALLATDGSSSARVAVDLIAGMRWPIGSSVRIVSAVDNEPDVFGGPGPTVGVLPRREADAELVKAALQDLDEAAEQLRALGLRVEQCLLRGRPADEIVADVRAHMPDLVLVGSRGHSALDRMLLGSVSSELVDRSSVPVLVARRREVGRVVVAVDGSEIAAEAVHAIRYWPFLSAAQIAVLSVAPSSALVARYGSHAELAAHELCSIGLDAQPEVRSGEAAHGIVSFAETWDADLIVTGSHGRTGLSRLVLGSVARNVLHHAACSVLIVKRHAAAVPVGEPALVGTAWTMAAAR